MQFGDRLSKQLFLNLHSLDEDIVEEVRTRMESGKLKATFRDVYYVSTAKEKSWHIHCYTAAAPTPRRPVGCGTPAAQVSCLLWNATFTVRVLVQYYWNIYPEMPWTRHHKA